MNAETVRTLLEQQAETVDPMRSGNGGGDTGLRLMPHAGHCQMRGRVDPYGEPVWTPAVCTCHLRAFVELDRLLELMRTDRLHPLLVTDDGKVSLRSLHWHLHQRYRRLDVTSKTVRYVAGLPVGVVERPGVMASKVHPLQPWQSVVVADPANWAGELAKMRRKHSRNPVDVRVRVASWHRDVREPLVTAGVEWVASAWTLRRVEREPEKVAA